VSFFKLEELKKLPAFGISGFTTTAYPLRVLRPRSNGPDVNLNEAQVRGGQGSARKA
jgi:hypothetical protein